MKITKTIFWIMAFAFALVWLEGIYTGLTVGALPKQQTEAMLEVVNQNNQMLRSLLTTGQFYSIKKFGDQEVILVPVAMRAFTAAQEKFKDKYGRYFEIQSSYRTSTAQDWLFKMFQAGKSAYPVENTGYSYHQVGLAVDVMEADMDRARPFLVAEGFHDLGSYDPVHFEYQWEGK